MSSGQILHGTHNGVEILRYRGEVQYTLCVALDRYLQRLLNRPGLRGFVVDLTGASSLDSTHLGILARLARVMQQRNLPQVTLISSQPDISEVLEAVGFDQVFHMVEAQEVGPDKLSEIPPVETESVSTSRLLLEAHRELMNLNKTNQEMFRDVVQTFEHELES